MTLEAFRASLGDDAPPAGVSDELKAMWHAGRDAWDTAHNIVQQYEGTPDADWVHAYLHRVEGDLVNAGYWYRRARKPEAAGTLDDEWTAIVTEFLGRAS